MGIEGLSILKTEITKPHRLRTLCVDNVLVRHPLSTELNEVKIWLVGGE